MENLTIKEASVHDTPIILELLYELGRPKPEIDSEVKLFRKLVTKYVVDPDKKLLVAKLDDVEIVGMVSIEFLTRLNRPNLEMYIPELIVVKKYQKKGIGKKLINSCIGIAKHNECYRIRLESGNQRKDSHAFYRWLGFTQPALSFTLNLN
ncbi:MAG: GNAT family N-acetyltransferase [Nitrosopumilus sp.]|uniref:GNAT family N-acetyltransferase n=1 Tax=Nitrosopumilus sp. TaxID=2024843 RepID=UPI00292E3D50|nr:GNAT family N-acetyltransferase [Nitrosopumilus sp.]